jgi:hypothetical protein
LQCFGRVLLRKLSQPFERTLFATATKHHWWGQCLVGRKPSKAAQRQRVRSFTSPRSTSASQLGRLRLTFTRTFEEA